MDIVKFCGVGIYSVFAVMIIREMKKEVSEDAAFGMLAVMLCLSFPVLSETLDFILSLAEYVNEESAEYISVILKALGVTYIAYFSSELCTRAGEGAIGRQICYLGRLEILLLCIPYFKKLLTLAAL